MTLNHSIFYLIIILNILSSSFSIFLAITAYRMKSNKIAFQFALLMSIFSIWALSKLASLFVFSLEIQIFLFHAVRSLTIFTPYMILLIITKYLKHSTKYLNILWILAASLSIFSLSRIFLALQIILIILYIFTRFLYYNSC